MLVFILILMVLGLGGYAFWILRQVWNKTSLCPVCLKEGAEEPLIPVLFNFLWWCLRCGELHKNRVLTLDPGRRFREIKEHEFKSRKKEHVKENVVQNGASEEEPQKPHF